MLKQSHVTILLAVFVILLSTVLTGCGALAQQPPTQAVRLAIVQQLTHSQQRIAQALAPSAASGTAPLKPNFKIDRLNISSRIKISPERFQQERYPTHIYKVKGTVETTLVAPGRKIHQSSPFEVYLGTNPSAKPAVSDKQENSRSDSTVETWYLIDPDEPTLPQ